MRVISVFIVWAILRIFKAEMIRDPTSTPTPNFSAINDADAIFKEYDKDQFKHVDRVGVILYHRTYDERMQIYNNYTAKYCCSPSGCNLKSDLMDAATNGIDVLFDTWWEVPRAVNNFFDSYDDLFDVTFSSSQEILAKAVHDTVEGRSGDHKAVEEVVCAQDNNMKKLIRDYYEATYHTKLEEHFVKYKKKDAPYQEAMLKHCWPPRGQFLKIDEGVAISEAEALRQIDPKTDKNPFKDKLKEFLANYSEADLKLIFQKYRQDGHGIDNAVDDAFDGNEKEAYGTLVRYIEDTCKYYADALQQAVKGGPMKIDIHRVDRIVITRCERDLKCILKKYEELYHRPFPQSLEKKTSKQPNYVKFIGYLCGEP